MSMRLAVDLVQNRSYPDVGREGRLFDVGPPTGKRDRYERRQRRPGFTAEEGLL